MRPDKLRPDEVTRGERWISTRRLPVQPGFVAVPPAETVPIDHVEMGIEAVNADEHVLKPSVIVR